MTDCSNAEIRDVLPDYVAELLTRAEMTRIHAHLMLCADCTSEVALLSVARAVRPQAIHIDVARIVSALPSASLHRLSTPPSMREKLRSPIFARRVWRAAAAIGLLVVGGWSLMMVRNGGVAMMGTPRSDTAQMGEAAENLPSAPAAAARQTAVSVGDLSVYSDVELQRLLSRLEQWDGATAAEPLSQVPIVPVAHSGSEP